MYLYLPCMCLLFVVLIVLAGVSSANAQDVGCRDPNASNYVAGARINDGSCQYTNVNYIPQRIANLPSQVIESSGLFYWKDLLWTHNDSGGEAALYALDPSNGQLVRKVHVAGASNVDWEDITIDKEHVYIADIGNNNGNRRNLKIYKFPVADLEKDTVHAVSIMFAYPDQVDFSSRPNKNDYDAEALVSIGDSLYIFSKNWESARCRIYALPKSEGEQSARLLHEFFTNGMITGADFQAKDSVVILCGYNIALQPFVWILWDFNGADIWSGNKRRINLNLPFHQVEGIVWKNDGEYLFTNEEFKNIFTVNSALFTMNTSAWVDLSNTYIGIPTSIEQDSIGQGFRLYPNPTKNLMNLEWEKSQRIQLIEVYDNSGRTSEVWSSIPEQNTMQLDLSHYAPGQYYMVLTGVQGKYYDRFIVQK